MSKGHRHGHQALVLLTEDGSAVDMRLPISKQGLAADLPKDDESGGFAWGLDSDNQVKDRDNGQFIQFVDERDATPLQIFGGLPVAITKDTINRVAEQVTDDAINYENSRRRRSYIVWLGSIAGVLTVVFTLVVLFKFVF